MLSYGHVAGRLSRITRHAHYRNFAEILKPGGLINVSYLRYSSKNKKTRANETTKIEECMPSKTKSFKKVPPLRPPPPAPPQLHTSPVITSETIVTSHRAPCDDKNYSCPANCPPAIQEICHASGGSGDKGSEFKYWKHLITAVILAGVSAYAYLEWSMKSKEKEFKKVDKSRKKRVIIPNPENSSSIPSEVPYLLIGGGTAAFSALRAIKAGDPTAKVLVITGEGDYPYMRPPLSKELWYNRDDNLDPKLMFKQWNGTKRSLFYEPPEFYLHISDLSQSAKGGVSVASGWKVKKIDVPNKTAYLEDGYQINYDKCLIATGSSPKNLSVIETADEKIKEKVVPFRTKDDYVNLFHSIKKPDVKNIVVIGGGFLGSELATSIVRNLPNKNQKVYQIYKEKAILAQVLPEYLSEWTTKHSEAEGVNCISGVEVHDCRIKNDRVQLILTNGQTLEADQIIVAVGVEANTQLAKESNLEVHPEEGGFLVNAELEARSNVWVAGDAACFYDVKLGRRRIEHHDHAVISGRLAGENMTGAKKPYLNQSMLWSDLGPEIGFEAIGIIDSKLETVGVFAKASENDTPLSATTSSDEGTRTSDKPGKSNEGIKPEILSHTNSTNKESELTKIESNFKSSEIESQKAQDDYGKGVIFYVRDNIVVGIVLWNIFNRMSVARQLIMRGTTYEEINEASKLFAIHEN